VIDAGISGVRLRDKKTGPFLTIMAGAENRVFEKAKPVLDALASRLFHVGGPGMGMTFKLVNNAISMTNLVVICEAISMGICAGANPKRLYEVLCQSGAGSQMLDDRYNGRILKRHFDGGMSIDLSCKDLSLVMEFARDYGVPIFCLTSAYSVHEWARSLGLGAEDRSALIKLWEKLLGFEARG
jgi:3-hydroxyisobutyrate dehydrogenase-like beta-hydroxyacid dehydrogenase